MLDISLSETKTNLFDIAEKNGIEIDYGNIPLCESLSIGNNICMDFSLLWGGANERVHLAHELGHCMTGSFYNRYAPLDVLQKHENRANKWAIKKLIPKDELSNAIKQGYTELWELAEYFDVTVPFMQKAVELYHTA